MSTPAAPTTVLGGPTPAQIEQGDRLIAQRDVQARMTAELLLAGDVHGARRRAREYRALQNRVRALMGLAPVEDRKAAGR